MRARRSIIAMALASALALAGCAGTVSYRQRVYTTSRAGRACAETCRLTGGRGVVDVECLTTCPDTMVDDGTCCEIPARSDRVCRERTIERTEVSAGKTIGGIVVAIAVVAV